MLPEACGHGRSVSSNIISRSLAHVQASSHALHGVDVMQMSGEARERIRSGVTLRKTERLEQLHRPVRFPSCTHYYPRELGYENDRSQQREKHAVSGGKRCIRLCVCAQLQAGPTVLLACSCSSGQLEPMYRGRRAARVDGHDIPGVHMHRPSMGRGSRGLQHPGANERLLDRHPNASGA